MTYYHFNTTYDAFNMLISLVIPINRKEKNVILLVEISILQYLEIFMAESIKIKMCIFIFFLWMYLMERQASLI